MAALHPETLLTGSTVDLSGDGWRLLGALPSAVDRPDGDGSPLGGDTGWIPASVPGSVQHDLRRAGLLDDLYVGRNTLAAEWAADRTWLYERAFEAPPEWRGSTVRLRLDRVDYAARFLLNGTPLGEHASIFTPAVFDVTDALAWEGENRLTVVLGPAPEEQDQMGRTSLVRTRKPRMGYWWDFCPRLVNLGLGGAVTLQRLPDARLEDVAVHPVLSTDAGRCDLRVEIDVDRGQGSPDRVRIEVDILSGKDRVAAVTAPVEAGSGRATVHLQLELTRPELWWPNGAGEQSMYRAEVRLATDSAVVDTRITAFGVRRIELVRNDTPDPDAPPYTFVINGRRIYITGWNWVPVDALYGVPRAEKLEHLLELAAAAHCNLLRVNGVGLIETAEFYEHCDRLGILVWQEFVLTSSATDRKPSEDAGYLAAVVDEALGIVRSRRNHPSLAVWCAGNELESLEKLPLDDSEPVIAALRQVATALDQDTVWLPTSARGRKPFNGLSSIRRDPDGLHDVHGPWLYEGLDAQYELYNAGTSLFHSELGAEAITNRETLHDVVPPAELTVAGMTGPTWRHLGAWWLRTDVWEQTFGVVDDLDKLVALTQFLQAEAVRYGVEANRRRAWRNSGSLPWQFDEPYPMVGSTAAVDYYGRPKPLYYAIAEAYAPVAVSARYDTLA
ncbi:MAG TPA: glycoside hydrolase family 2 TIM barrel-domain containing protein, partial [Naasia sp.]